MELGLATFADLAAGVSPQQRMRNLLEEAKLADELGLDVFAIGEHHRPDYLVSSPTVALGAAAAITDNIRLSSAVTVLSSEDPVRVFQQFAEVDLISGGRAEIMAGRRVRSAASEDICGELLMSVERFWRRRLAAGDLGADDRRDLGAEQLHRAQNVGVGDRPNAHLADVALVAEELVAEQDLLGDLLGRASGHRAIR